MSSSESSTHTAAKESDDSARVKINQTINDLETGYTKPSNSKESYTTGHTEREKVTNRPQIDNLDRYSMDAKKFSNKILYALTGKALTKGEFKYTKEMVANTKTHRLNIAKSADFRELNSFKTMFLEPLKVAVDSMLDIIDQEMQVAEKKTEMMSK